MRATPGQHLLQSWMDRSVIRADNIGRGPLSPRNRMRSLAEIAHRLCPHLVDGPRHGIGVAVVIETRGSGPGRQGRSSVGVGDPVICEIRSLFVRQRRRFVDGRRSARLPSLEREGTQIYKMLYRGMDACFGDDGAAVGVAEQYDVAINSVKAGEHARSVTVEVGEAPSILAVAGEVDRNSRNICFPEERHHPVKAPSTVPGTVDKHNRCGHQTDDGMARPVCVYIQPNFPGPASTLRGDK